LTLYEFHPRIDALGAISERKAASIKNGQVTSDNLRNGIRHIAFWNLWLSVQARESLQKEGLLLSSLGDKLPSVLSELELHVLYRVSKGHFNERL
jgi:hypothetical protein